jgi:acyl dehydratase
MTRYEVVAVNLDPQADNRIHDDDVAQRFGFAGALVPGVEVFALASAPLVRDQGEAFLSGGRLALRFRRPVYDGERVTVTADESVLSVTGPDGVVRASGSYGPAAAVPVGAYDDAPLPETLLEAPRPGPFGTVRMPPDPAACGDYVRRIGEPSPLYADRVHPGLLLRLVNLALMSNVALGPWIHTASDCRFLAAARTDEPVEVRSRVTELFERKGNDYVRYDALVLAGGRPVAEVHHEAIWRLGGG